jgi:hypothetical protein
MKEWEQTKAGVFQVHVHLFDRPFRLVCPASGDSDAATTAGPFQSFSPGLFVASHSLSRVKADDDMADHDGNPPPNVARVAASAMIFGEYYNGWVVLDLPPPDDDGQFSRRR